MIKEKWFKVKYGYQVSDQVSIKEDELEKAIYAQKFGVVTQLANKQINGKYIIAIEPHYHKYTGWYDFYEPKDGDDWKQIERDCPKGLDVIIRDYREKVDYLLGMGRLKDIGKNVEIPELKRIEISEVKQPEIKKLSDDLVNKFQI